MYIAKQVSPEWQEDDLFFNFKGKDGKTHIGWNDDVYQENVIIYGNNEYLNSTIKEFDNLLELDNVYYEYEPLLNPKSNHCYWSSITEFINAYFPKSKGKYSTKEIHEWKVLLERYSNRWRIEDIVCDALKLMTGKQWIEFRMTGCMQREWQNGYASEEITRKDIEYIEMCYFNTGSEYIIYESEEDYENDNSLFSLYVDSYDSKEKLCERIGCEPNELKVYNFAGYKKVPQYEEATE